MKMIQSFDPSAAASGSFQHQIANACGGVYLFNESNQWLQLTLPDGGNVGLPAWWSRFYYLADVQGPVLWQVLDTIATIASPLSKVYGESYERSEIIGRKFYDGPIPRNPYIANQVSSNVSTNQVINDGNPAVSTVVEATQSGNTGGSNLFMGNDGSAYFAQWVSSVFTKLFTVVPGASPLLQIGKNVIVQGADSAGVFGNIFGVDGNKNTFIQNHPSNNQTVIYDKNGNVLVTFDANLCLNVAGTIQQVSGDTSGQMTVQEIFSGGSKWVIVKQNNYRQNGAAQQLVLKNAFTGPFAILNLGCGGMQLLNGASVQSGNYFNSLAATGSTFLAETSAQQCTIGWNNTAIDRIQSQGGYASAHTGVFILAGF